MTPLQAIRKACVGSPFLVKDCGGDKRIGGQGDKDGVCRFYKYRMGKGRPSVKLIRKFCLECMAGDKKLVAECSSRDCPVHLFRLGTNPNFTEATREQRRQRALQHCFGR